MKLLLLILLALSTAFVFSEEETEASERLFTHAAPNMYRESCNAEFCDPNHEPLPNIWAAVSGYNILKSNPLVAGQNVDPGFSNSYIFQATVKNDEDKYTMNSGLHTSRAQSCELSYKTQESRTLSEYADLMANMFSEGVGWTSNLEFDVSVEKGPVGVSTTIPPLLSSAHSSSKDFQNVGKFMEQTSGVVATTQAYCTVYVLSIDEYDAPPFHNSMKSAIEELNEGVNKSKATQRKMFDKFIKTFGTHYYRKVNMGGRLVYSRKYTIEEYQQSDTTKRKNCGKEKFDVTLFGVGRKSQESSCKITGTSRGWGGMQSFERESITSYGSSPSTSMTEWSKQDFDSPLPIKMELSPILNLFTDAFMKKMPNIRYKEIRDYLIPLYYNYCTDNRNKFGIEHCDLDGVSGCGYTDTCNRETEYCSPKDNEKGYECCVSICGKDTNPCQNGGICHHTPVGCGFICECPPLYRKGLYCQSDVTEQFIQEVVDSHEERIDEIVDQPIWAQNLNIHDPGFLVYNRLKDEFEDHWFLVCSYDRIPPENIVEHSWKELSLQEIELGFSRENWILLRAHTSKHAYKLPSKKIFREMKKRAKEAAEGDGTNCSSDDIATRADLALMRFGFPIALLHVVYSGHHATCYPRVDLEGTPWKGEGGKSVMDEQYSFSETIKCGKQKALLTFMIGHM